MPLLSALSFPLCFTTSLIPLCHHLSLFHLFHFLHLSQFNSKTQSSKFIFLPNLHISIHFSPILISLHHRGVPLHSSLPCFPSFHLYSLFIQGLVWRGYLTGYCQHWRLASHAHTKPHRDSCVSNPQMHRFIKRHAKKAHTALYERSRPFLSLVLSSLVKPSTLWHRKNSQVHQTSFSKLLFKSLNQYLRPFISFISPNFIDWHFFF